MRNGLLALAASLLLHGVLALAAVVLLMWMPVSPDAVAQLDLSSVELSFAEQDAEAAPLAPLPPAQAAQPSHPPQNPQPERPKDVLRPPEPEAPRFPEPIETSPHVETPSAPPVPAEAPRQARVDAPPKPKRSIRPEYPRGARQRGEQGDVTLEIAVSEKGSVDRVVVVTSSGFPELDAAACRAAQAARFSPARADGANVASVARLTLTFRLR